MKPEPKAPGIEALLRDLSGKDRIQAITDRKCTWCDTPNFNWTDAASESEYSISGQCQNCQDIAFADPEDEDEIPDDDPEVEI